MELYNIYHTIEGTDSAQYSPYSNSTVDAYMDQALASNDLESLISCGSRHSGTESQA